ncbi:MULTISPECIES: DNA-processing protein DprA [unclassified Salinibacterium]|uniref:DNA-processing protein DprA n=1 Tax=unclassified Salinibacterium TaxID=2632331 RepID=UPI001424A40C|nr:MULTISPECIES: DNA-processing protein DprA [unclassified Salinibacterium]
MSIFGLTEAAVAPLVRDLTRDDLDREELVERLALAAWTGIAEPGDRDAGELIAAQGAPVALAALIDQWPADRMVAMLTESGITATADAVTAALDRWRPRLSSSGLLRSLQQALLHGIRLLVPTDDGWPRGFDDLGPHAPLAVWTKGKPHALPALDRSLALVGARAATGYGESVTLEASSGLVDRGFAIVSGAAYGIDGMAHRAALASRGVTVAFLAGGLDRFYPTGHEALLARMTEVGMVISEVPCGTAPTKWRFLQRNRLIAAASQATVVLEAGWRSGSLNTAGHAAAMGRPLGAVPGPVTSAASAGCHRLIREYDAICVTNPDEMAQLHPGFDDPPPVSGAALNNPEQLRVLDALSSRSARRAADIAARCGLSVAQVQGLLATLELEGRVTERDTGWLRQRR